jgi:hypothetical protein
MNHEVPGKSPRKAYRADPALPLIGCQLLHACSSNKRKN